ncbi:hypothetical protein glysoja_002249 [Glycine soja]|nr:hypothetical protein glysoja_002249 [Glycine soja]
MPDVSLFTTEVQRTLSQTVGGPLYKLLLKKEKARGMNINSVQWSLGEKPVLASASDDGTIKVWELISY